MKKIIIFVIVVSLSAFSLSVVGATPPTPKDPKVGIESCLISGTTTFNILLTNESGESLFLGVRMGPMMYQIGEVAPGSTSQFLLGVPSRSEAIRPYVKITGKWWPIKGVNWLITETAMQCPVASKTMSQDTTPASEGLWQIEFAPDTSQMISPEHGSVVGAMFAQNGTIISYDDGSPIIIEFEYDPNQRGDLGVVNQAFARLTTGMPYSQGVVPDLSEYQIYLVYADGSVSKSQACGWFGVNAFYPTAGGRALRTECEA